jgi:ParB family transcriptional regulator, chromosome partitioning protein
MPLLNRESAIARLASDKARQMTQLLLDPARVRARTGNARIYASLAEASCREPIESILAKNGQKVPAVVRPIDSDPPHDYEVIAGSQRRWPISSLRANSYLDMVFVAPVLTLDGQSQTCKIARVRTCQALEPAQSYATTFTSYYSGDRMRTVE